MVSFPPILIKEYFVNVQACVENTSVMVGDLQRVIEHPKQGYQIPRVVPDGVRVSVKLLSGNEFNKHNLQRQCYCK